MNLAFLYGLESVFLVLSGVVLWRMYRGSRFARRDHLFTLFTYLLAPAVLLTFAVMLAVTQCK